VIGFKYYYFHFKLSGL